MSSLMLSQLHQFDVFCFDRVDLRVLKFYFPRQRLLGRQWQIRSMIGVCLVNLMDFETGGMGWVFINLFSDPPQTHPFS